MTPRGIPDSPRTCQPDWAARPGRPKRERIETVGDVDVSEGAGRRLRRPPRPLWLAEPGHLGYFPASSPVERDGISRGTRDRRPGCEAALREESMPMLAIGAWARRRGMEAV